MKEKTDNTRLSNGVIQNGIFYPQKNLPSGTLRIVLTTKCNFKCKYCFAEGEKDKENRVLDIEKLKPILKIAKEFGINKIKLTGGEPLLYSKIEELLKYCREIGIPYIDLTTNISMLNKEKIGLLNKYRVNALTLSLDTLEEAKFEYLSGFKNFKLIENNLKNVIENFKGKLRVNCIIFDEKYNSKDYDEIIKFCKENNLGLRLVEPSKVEGLPITYTKEKFAEYINTLRKKATRVITSNCKSVEYFFFDDNWYITVMHSLCDNKLCDSCIDYMYIRITSEFKLKPCLARRDTEVNIDYEDEDQIRKSFIKAINYMGVGVKDEIE